MTPLTPVEIAKELAAVRAGTPPKGDDQRRLAVYFGGLEAMNKYVSPLLEAAPLAFKNALQLRNRCGIEAPGLSEAWWIAGRAVFPRPGEAIATDAVQPRQYAAALGGKIELSTTVTSAIVSDPASLDGLTAAPDCRIAVIRDSAAGASLIAPLGLTLRWSIDILGVRAVDIYDAETGALIEIAVNPLDPATASALDSIPRRTGAASRAVAQAPAVAAPIAHRRKPAGERTPVGPVFEAYRPRHAIADAAKPHPTALIAPSTLASIDPPAITVQPRLPADAVASGAISDAQFEGIALCMSAHERKMRDGRRFGFLLADGTGVGKTNEEAGLVAANRAEGRPRAVYVSEKSRHKSNLEKALAMLGMARSDVIDVSAYRSDDPLPNRAGVLFMTYVTLREGDEDGQFPRIDQIEAWTGRAFDGLIIFDEAHNLRNAVGENGTTRFGAAAPSRQGIAGLELQARFPDARVVYATATGCSSVHNLAYMDRLGLWGEGRPFATAKDALEAIEAMGLTGLEIISSHLVASGLMTTRTLSLNGVEVSSLFHALTPEERTAWDETSSIVLGMRDSLVAAWKLALGETKNAPTEVTSQFEAAARRICEMMLVSMKTPELIADMRRAIDEGKAPVVQLMNTYEADTTDPDATAVRNLRRLIDAFIPTQRLRRIRGARRGFVASYEPALDRAGAPIPLPANEALKKTLIDRLAAIPEHKPPLDQIISAFGAHKIAEITGRSVRTIDDPARGPVLERRTEQDVRADLAAFMGDRKQALVFSVGAGGSSMDYHAALDARNQRRRRHYVLQPGQRADQAVQGIGRTNRSNQSCAPEVVLVSTDLPAERAYLSQTLARIRKLGAAGQGHRDAATGPFAMRHSYENSYARAAFTRFLAGVVAGKYPDVHVAHFQAMTAIQLMNRDGKTVYLTDDATLRRIMNRIARTSIAFQTTVFGHIDHELEIAIENSLTDRTFDSGPEHIDEPLEIVSDEVIHTDPATGAEIRAFRALGAKPPPLADYDAAMAEAELYNDDGDAPRVGWSPLTNQVWISTVAERANDSYETPKKLRLIEPHRTTIVDYASQLIYNAERIPTFKDDSRARHMWQGRAEQIADMMSKPAIILTGAIPLIQDILRLGQGQDVRYRAVVAETTDGRRIMGLMMPQDVGENIVAAVRADNRFAAAGQKVDVSGLEAALDASKTLVLANNWMVNRQLALGDTRFEVHPHTRDAIQARAVARQLDLLKIPTPGAPEPRYFLPVEPARRRRALAILTTRFPVARTDDVPDWSILTA